MHTDGPNTPCLMGQLNAWFVFSSATQNRMHSSYLDRYQATVTLTSSFFLPVCRREAYGKCTTLLLKRMLMPTLLHTPRCRLWRTLLPSVIIMKPMNDLCWTCHRNSTAILLAANSSEASKSSTIREAEEHLHIVQIERSFYKSTCDSCRKSVRAFFTIDGEFHPPALSSTITPNTRDIKVHYSFDYAQQVHFPSDPLHPGPIYFLTPRKCTVFGVNCEALPRQVNFLTDEAGECGKGANNVVICLHYFL